MPQRSARALLPLALATAVVLPGTVWASEPGPPPHAGQTAGRAPSLDPGLDTRQRGPVDVVVQGRPGADVAAAVRRVGGQPGAALPLVDGLEAAVPAARLDALADDPAVLAVTADRDGRLLGAGRGSRAGEATRADVPSYVASTGADAAWARGVDGRGVGIAVLDTGVSAVPDLAGRIVHGPDLSGEDTPVDTYGHGTVMAGLAAGDGRASHGAHRGVAPGATVVAVKVAGRDGDVDVSTVLQAMHWVSAHADQYGIRVLNLSWGVPSTQDPAVDPLDRAVERLWRQGIVVVVGAGNAGPATGTVTKPADSPSVLTVGALDDRRNLDPRDDTVPDWSSRGPTSSGVAKPDLVAPGRSLVATRSPGSSVEADHPGSLVAPGYITGSGTSQAAAVTSGLAALLLADRPGLTPDQVKGLLVSTATRVPGSAPHAAGAGRAAIDRALAADPGPAVQQAPAATGLGSLVASGARTHVDECGARARGATAGAPHSECAAWTGSSWTGSSWTGSGWTGSSWTGSSWTGSSWTGSSWTGSSWTAASWDAGAGAAAGGGAGAAGTREASGTAHAR